MWLMKHVRKAYGVVFRASEKKHPRSSTAPRDDRHGRFNFLYCHFKNVEGEIEGIVIASDVTEQVLEVVMREEDVAQRRERHVGEDKLTRDPVAAVDHVRNTVHDDDLSHPELAFRGRGPPPVPSRISLVPVLI